MSEAVLEVSDLSKSFGDFTAVDGLSFSIARGEVFGVLGVNGAGKTTAINMILGLLTPSGGSISVFGKDLTRHRIEILRRVNFCSTYTQLPSNLRVWQNLMVFGRLYGVENPKQRIDEVLELLEISHLKKKVTGELSAGESTRLSLCKALINMPSLLLLDEPTASLDPDIADKVRKLVRHVQTEHNMAILYTSHNMRDVEEVCDRVAFLDKGKILAEGTPDDILHRFDETSLEQVFIRVARGGDLKPKPDGAEVQTVPSPTTES
jgi:ABC-2 type transport system ATP-binding protein